MKQRAILPCLALLLLGALCLGCAGPAEEDRLPTESTTVQATGTPSTTTTTFPPTTTSQTTTTTQPSPAEQLLRSMDLRQKAAQVLLLTVDGTSLSPSTEALLTEGPPAGVLLLSPNVSNASQLTAFTQALQQAAVAGGSPVGLFIAVDQEGGPVQRIRDGVPAVPAARSLGDGSSTDEAGRLAAETADGLLALGVNMNLAPVADVVGDKASFLYRRTYAGEPLKVAGFVSAVIEAFVRQGLISVAKHFPGHGSASGDTHAARVISDAAPADFEAVHLPPFRAAIEAGVEGVMMAHVVATAYDPERPSSQSNAVVEGLLREKLGFTGLVITDDLRMSGTATGTGAPTPGETAIASLEAGCDLLIFTGPTADQRDMWEAIVAAVESGRLPISRLDQAVLRVLHVKIRHGIAAPQSPR